MGGMTKSQKQDSESEDEFPKTVYADFAHGTVHRVVNSQEELDDFLAHGWREE